MFLRISSSNHVALSHSHTFTLVSLSLRFFLTKFFHPSLRAQFARDTRLKKKETLSDILSLTDITWTCYINNNAQIVYNKAFVYRRVFGSQQFLDPELYDSAALIPSRVLGVSRPKRSCRVSFEGQKEKEKKKERQP